MKSKKSQGRPTKTQVSRKSPGRPRKTQVSRKSPGRPRKTQVSRKSPGRPRKTQVSRKSSMHCEGDRCIRYSIASDMCYDKDDNMWLSEPPDNCNMPVFKTTKTNKHGKNDRLSAKTYYESYGKDSSLGDVCQIRADSPELKCLLKRSNNTVYWAAKSKSGKGQEKCGNWKKNCKINLIK